MSKKIDNRQGEWIETGNGEAIRFKHRSSRPEPTRIEYLVPDAKPVTSFEVLYLPESRKPAMAASRS